MDSSDQEASSSAAAASNPEAAARPMEGEKLKAAALEGDEKRDVGENGEEEGKAEGDDLNTLTFAEELIEKGIQLRKAGDNVPAVDCLSRAVEICVGLFGELSPKCVKAYYEYGRALLYKAQDESDPLVDVPKEPNTGIAGAEKAVSRGESSTTSVATAGCITTDSGKEIMCDKIGESGENSSPSIAAQIHEPMEEPDDDSGRKDEEGEYDESEDEDLEDADEDESDLDLAWKMLDVARAIVEKQPENTLQKVKILEALGEISLEREEFETSLSDYLKALNILESLVEHDSRHVAEINFRICLVLEVASRFDEAIPYCKKAMSLCGSCLERLKEETKDQDVSTTKTAETSLLDLNQSADEHPDRTQSINLEKLKEIKALSELLSDLEKKLEDLEQAAQNPKSVVSELLKVVGSKLAFGNASPAPRILTSDIDHMAQDGFSFPTTSTSATNGGSGSSISVTDLGVVGRGVKRANVSSSSGEQSLKKPTTE